MRMFESFYITNANPKGFWRLLVASVTLFLVGLLIRHSRTTTKFTTSYAPRNYTMMSYSIGTSFHANDLTTETTRYVITTTEQASLSKRSGNGYIFALEFSDQGTGSFVNLMTFLCFATNIGGVRIVEPFMVGSILGFNVSSNWKTELRFRDVFSLDGANKFARYKKIEQMVPFDEFLSDAPRKLLVAQHKCTLCSISCGHPNALEPGKIFAKIHGFEVVGQVCLDYKTNGKTTLKEVENQLYKQFNKSDVVVMFLHFGGLEKGGFRPNHVYRLYIILPGSCYRSSCHLFQYIRPSKLVEKSAGNYIDKFLHGKRYISVMIRIQMIIANHKNDLTLAKKCLNHVYRRITELRSKRGINSTFICVDVGKYGSNWAHNQGTMKQLMPIFDSFISSVTGIRTLLEYDDMFKQTSMRDNPGFIAMMQKSIAARGEALVLLGKESNYQRSAEELYKSKHNNNSVFIYKPSPSCHDK